MLKLLCRKKSLPSPVGYAITRATKKIKETDDFLGNCRIKWICLGAAIKYFYAEHCRGVYEENINYYCLQCLDLGSQ